MPTWGELLHELETIWVTPEGTPDLDRMRRHYQAELSAYTGRNTVVYETDWLNPAKASSPDLAIGLGDIQGLMEVFKDLDTNVGLDLILHTPGGDPTAADSFVRYMRNKFSDVRVIVPIAAMSAGTMWALAADAIVMGKHSQLGPIDPQLNFGRGMIPAGAIKRNFLKAQEECAKDPARLSGWVPTLNQYFPGLIEMCDDYTKLSRTLVADYLEHYMFRRRKNRVELASKVADFFADDTHHMAHGRGIGLDRVKSLGVKVVDLETDPRLQDLVLTIHHGFSHTFGMTPAAKILENNLGRTWIRWTGAIAPLPTGP